MHVALFRNIITSTAFCAVLTACADQPRIVHTKSGGEVQLPACKDYVSRFYDISIRGDILNKYQGELKLSATNKTTLDTLQQDYVIQARHLCENAPLYINSGQVQQYLCRDERLSNSVTQLRTLNSLLEGIHNAGDAKAQAENINKLVDDFMRRFYTQFDKACSEPPQPLSRQEMEIVVADSLRKILEEDRRLHPPSPAPNLPQKEVVRELSAVQKELRSLSENVEKEYAEGDSYYKEKNFDTAIRHFKNAIDLMPGIPSLYLALGNGYFAINQYSDALATYEDGLKVAKKSEQVYVYLITNRGSVRMRLGLLQEAINDFSVAIRLQPNEAPAYFNRGLANHKLKDFQRAVADYSDTIKLKLQPENAYIYTYRGLAKCELHDFQGALADYTEAIKLQPDSAVAYHYRGLIKDKLNDLQGALADYNEAIRLQADESAPYYNRGMVKFRRNDFQGAIADLTAAIKFKPSYDAFRARSLAHTALGNEKAATINKRP